MARKYILSLYLNIIKSSYQIILVLIFHWTLGLSEIILKVPQRLQETIQRFLNP